MQNKSAYLWGGAGKFAPQGLYLITTMVLARYLTPDDFGMVGVLSIIFTVAGILLDAGLGGSLVKEKNITEEDKSSISIFNVVVSLLIYIVLFLSANHVELYFGKEGLGNVLRWISLVFPITAFGLVPQALLTRALAYRQICYISILSVVCASIVSIIFALNGMGVYSLVAYQLSIALVTVISSSLFAKYFFTFHFSVSSLKRLLPFGMYTTLITVLDSIYENLLTAISGKFLNMQQAGFMYQAKRTEETMSVSLATTVSGVAFPVLTKIKDERETFVREAASTIKVIASIALPLMLTVGVFSEEILVLLFGKQWADASFYLTVLTFAGVFLLLETLVRNFIKALCEVKKLFYATIIKRLLGILIIVLFLMVDPTFIVYGYLVSTIMGLLINMFLYNYIIKSSYLKLIVNIFLIIFPSFLYFGIMMVVANFISDVFIVKAIFALILLLIIYLLVLPFEGINFFSYIKNKLKNERD